MRKSTIASLMLALTLSLLLFAPAGTSSAQGRVDPAVYRAFDQSSMGTARFIVVLRERANLSFAQGITERSARKVAVVNALKETAQNSQASLLTTLGQLRSANQVTSFQAFFSANALGVVGTREAVAVIVSHPAVESIEPDPIITLEPPSIGIQEPRIGVVQWNIDKIRAPQVWSERGYSGRSTKVSNIDTGVRHTHQALVTRYACPAVGPHTTCWLDAISGLMTPYDDNVGVWHGTHTMGTAVGGPSQNQTNTGPNFIGVAPSAKWIACKAFNAGGSATGTDILECSDFLMAPGGSAANAPDVINNSWGGGFTSTFFVSMVNAWVAAGIFPAFANGNSGPACQTTDIPGAYAQSYGVGATNINDMIASFSGRGPSRISPFPVKPNVSAPGVSVTSSTGLSDFSYGSLSGTSMATPHVTGLVALLLSKNPSLSITQLRSLIDGGAIFISDTQCGGPNPPNNVYGWGRIDALNSIDATPP